jgi:hypothetical protein
MGTAFKSSQSASNANQIRDIILWHQQNLVPGLASWTLHKRIAAPSGFFMRRVCTRISMVGYVGAPKGAPGSCVTGRPTLRSSPPKIGLKGGEPLITQGFTYEL